MVTCAVGCEAGYRERTEREMYVRLGPGSLRDAERQKDEQKADRLSEQERIQRERARQLAALEEVTRQVREERRRNEQLVQQNEELRRKEKERAERLAEQERVRREQAERRTREEESRRERARLEEELRALREEQARFREALARGTNRRKTSGGTGSRSTQAGKADGEDSAWEEDAPAVALSRAYAAQQRQLFELARRRELVLASYRTRPPQCHRFTGDPSQVPDSLREFAGLPPRER
jgi:hypothetical protein